jgi:hypothetical protein
VITDGYVLWSRVLKKYRNHNAPISEKWVTKLEEAELYNSVKIATRALRSADDGTMYILYSNFRIMTKEEALAREIMKS